MIKSQLPEEWRSVKDWPYEVSSIGRVRRTETWGASYAGMIIRHRINHGGYEIVSLSNNTKRRDFRVNVLVCAAFHGQRPSSKHVAAHWDGNKENNSADNLRWATPKENGEDTIRLGRSPRGERHGLNRLSTAQVIKIKSLLKEGESTKKIAYKMSVPASLIYPIKNGNSWGWLD